MSVVKAIRFAAASVGAAFTVIIASTAQADVIVSYSSEADTLGKVEQINPAVVLHPDAVEMIEKVVTTKNGVEVHDGSTMYHSCNEKYCSMRHALPDGSRYILLNDWNGKGFLRLRDRKGKTHTMPLSDVALGETVISANSNSAMINRLAGADGQSRVKSMLAGKAAMAIMDEHAASNASYDCGVSNPPRGTLGDQVHAEYVARGANPSFVEDICNEYMRRTDAGRQALRDEASNLLYQLLDYSQNFEVTPLDEYMKFAVDVGQYGTHEKTAKERWIVARAHRYSSKFEVTMPMAQGMPPQVIAMLKNMKVFAEQQGKVWLASDRLNPHLDFSVNAIADEIGWTYMLSASALSEEAPFAMREYTRKGGLSQGGGLMMRDQFMQFANIFGAGLPLKTEITSTMSSTMPLPLPRKPSRSSARVDGLVLVPAGKKLPSDLVTQF